MKVVAAASPKIVPRVNVECREVTVGRSFPPVGPFLGISDDHLALEKYAAVLWSIKLLVRRAKM